MTTPALPREFAVRSFPWRRRGVLVPARDRRTSALGVCMFTASNRVPLRIQVMSYWATRAVGSIALAGRARPWRAPLDPALWAAITTAWTEAVGPVDALAVYQRRQEERDGITALLTRAGAPVAIVKLRDDGESLLREQAALSAIGAVSPSTFSAPHALGAGSVDGLHWSAQEAVFTRPHRPVFDAPPELFDDVRQCLEQIPREGPETPPGAELSHHDLTPWNLRLDHRGRRWLYDWEDWTPAPAGSDRAYFWVTSRALTGRPVPTDLSTAGLQHWRERVERRESLTASDIALRSRILAGIDGALKSQQGQDAPV